MFSLIIYDCIITTNENTDLVKTLLIKKVKETYQSVLSKNSDLDKLFKVEKVSEIITYNWLIWITFKKYVDLKVISANKKSS